MENDIFKEDCFFETIDDAKPMSKRRKFILYTLVAIGVIFFLPIMMLMISNPKKKKGKGTHTHTIVEEGFLWDTEYKVYKH